ncbi:hypothetical protein PR048_024838 [Dryococelus australis]|uniref:Uncharacterized protein n=1 Tax=Dryococelus australis TaxID=614101 RepID=A0ABQ9GPS7_9NEOP|nr:hypothetical protein PR048_024838 [Dryococelus australis]
MAAIEVCAYSGNRKEVLTNSGQNFLSLADNMATICFGRLFLATKMAAIVVRTHSAKEAAIDVVTLIARLPPRRTGLTPGFSQVGIVPGDGADRRVFFGGLLFPPPLHSTAFKPLHSVLYGCSKSCNRETKIPVFKKVIQSVFAVRYCEISLEKQQAANVSGIKKLTTEDSREKLAGCERWRIEIVRLWWQECCLTTPPPRKRPKISIGKRVEAFRCSKVSKYGLHFFNHNTRKMKVISKLITFTFSLGSLIFAPTFCTLGAESMLWIFLRVAKIALMFCEHHRIKGCQAVQGARRKLAMATLVVAKAGDKRWRLAAIFVPADAREPQIQRTMVRHREGAAFETSLRKSGSSTVGKYPSCKGVLKYREAKANAHNSTITTPHECVYTRWSKVILRGSYETRRNELKHAPSLPAMLRSPHSTNREWINVPLAGAANPPLGSSRRHCRATNALRWLRATRLERSCAMGRHTSARAGLTGSARASYSRVFERLLTSRCWEPNEGDARLVWCSVGMQGRGKPESPEKTRRPALSSGTVPTYEYPGVIPTGLETIRRLHSLWSLSSPRKGSRWPSGYPARLPPRPSEFNTRPGHRIFSHVGIVPDDVVGWRVFSRISRFPPPLFRRCSMLILITLIGSQDLVVNSRQNLLTHSSLRWLVASMSSHARGLRS